MLQFKDACEFLTAPNRLCICDCSGIALHVGEGARGPLLLQVLLALGKEGHEFLGDRMIQPVDEVLLFKTWELVHFALPQFPCLSGQVPSSPARVRRNAASARCAASRTAGGSRRRRPWLGEQ